MRSGRLWISFTIPDDTGSVYLGDLMLLMEKGRYAAVINDNYEGALKEYRTKYPRFGDKTTKNLMKSESKLGSYDDVKYVCHDSWGIDCTKKFRGVTPIQPVVSGESPTLVDQLTPIFEWQASSEPEITYDLVVYEGFAFIREGLVAAYLPGRIVVYQEGLSSAAWRPDVPFEKGRKYFWSVRLRKEGVVSTWSRYSYFTFYVIGWKSGQGNWFSFATPG